MSGQEPGGGPPSAVDPGGSSGRVTPDLSSLQESFNQQQAKITALRELVRQTEFAHGKKTASAQEKVKNIAQRLTQYKTKATKSRLSRASSSEVQMDLMGTRINEEDSSFDLSGIDYEEQQHMSLPVLPMMATRGRSETPGSEKITLLRQQMEQNRLKMAERESHKREMEEKVSELKHKLESTQQTLERSVEFGRSTGDLTLLTPMKMGRFDFNKSTSDLTQLAGTGYGSGSNFDVERLKYLEGRVKVLEQQLANKENIPVKDELMKDMERKILDLEEALKEKECIIEARTQAVSLMSENLSLKGKNTVDLLEDTKQEMYRMQSNFVQAESNLKAELSRLQLELDERNSKISNLEEMNNILETARYDLTVENSSLTQKLEDVQDFSTKISELNKVNQSLQHRIVELESQKYEFITDAEVEQAKFGETDEKYRELLDRIQELEEELARKATPEDDLLEKIRSLEATIEAQAQQIESFTQQQSELQENLQEKTVELNVLTANFSVLQEKLKTAGPKPLFPKTADEEAEGEINKLKHQLDEANKASIKSKLKIKQLQKQVDSFKKTSSVHEEVVRLTDEVQNLTQRLAEVEEEKGNLQLHLVNYDGSLPDSELEKRIKILEATCQNQTTAIQLLEEQKLDLSEDLNSSRHQLAAIRDQVKGDEQSGRISCQMSSIDLEEKLERCVSERDQLAGQLQRLEQEKLQLQQKLDRYMVENIELLDKIEKLSLEKVSSAESIEIVEGLTPKEKQEIECYEAAAAAAAAGRADERSESDEKDDTGSDETDKSHPRVEGDDEQQRRIAGSGGDDDDDQPVEDEEDLNASLVKLREESSELMHRIELFTNERREVLGKLEAITIENQAHQEELEVLRREVRQLKEQLAEMEGEKVTLVGELDGLKRLCASKLAEEEVSETSSSQGTPVRAGAPPVTAVTIDRESYEQALRSVDNEVTNFNRNKDKNKKLQISKKLASDAKNLQKVAATLLGEYCRSVEECEAMKAEIELMKEKVGALPPPVAASEGEVSALKAQILEITNAHIEKVDQIDQLRREVERKNEMLAELKRAMEVSRDAEKSSDEEPELLKIELNSKVDEIRELKKELEALASKTGGDIEELKLMIVSANKESAILRELVAEQKQQLIDSYQENEKQMADKLEEIQNYDERVDRMKKEQQQLQLFASNQKEDIAAKQETIDTLNNQIIELYKSMEENANKIIEKDDEVQYLQELLECKKDEIQMLQEKLTDKDNSLEKVHQLLAEAKAHPVVDETRVREFEARNQELDAKNKELMDKLKKFAANLKKKNVQCQQLEEKLAESQQQMEELRSAPTCEEELRAENEELAQKMHHLNNELHKLLQQKYSLESEKQAIQHELVELQERGRLAELKVQEVEQKLAQASQELADRQAELGTLQEDASSKSVKIEKCKAIIKEKNKEIQRLQEYERKKAYLEDELRMSQSKLEDFHNQTLLLGKLKADKEEMNGALKAEADRVKELEQELSMAAERVRKLEVDLELADEENRKLKSQIVRLEEGLSLVEQRRNSLERQKKLLGEELSEKAQEYSQHEDELMQRLANLSQHDEAIEAKLREKEEKYGELSGRLENAGLMVCQLEEKVQQLEKQVGGQEEAFRRTTELENENYNLNQQITGLQAELKRAVADAERKVTEKDTEIDQLEVELTNQLTRIENERKQLQENLERSTDRNADLQDEIVRLQESVNSLEQSRSDLEKEVTWLKMQNESHQQDGAELQELRMQIVQDQTELENLRSQSESMAQNHQCEINALRQQIADMEAIRTQLSQNQTDDQVFVQNEIIKLKDLLEQKEELIATLQMQNSRMEMLSSAVNNPFSGLQGPSTSALEEKIRDLENDALWKDSRIEELKIEKDLAEGSLEELRKQLQMLERRLERDEAAEAQLVEKGSQLEAMSKQLFQTVTHAKQQPQQPAVVSTSQFFSSPSQSSAASLFDSVAESWGWNEPSAVQQSQAPAEASALGSGETETQKLLEEIAQLKSQNEAARNEIKQLQTQISAFVDRDDEFHQLKDEVDILRAQNSSFSYELEEKTSRIHGICQQLQEEQMKNCSLEEQLKNQETPAAVSTAASFFTDSPGQAPVFEEIVVPKKAYLCTPSHSEDRTEGWAVEEPMLMALTSSSQEAVPTAGSAHDQCLEKQIKDQQQEIEQLNARLDEQHQQNSTLHDQLNQQKESTEKSLEALRAQQQQHLDTILSEKQSELDQFRSQSQLEHKQLKEELNRLQQDRDAYLQLQDELEIVKANNASLLDEIREKSEKLTRVCHTLTEAQTQLATLEEQQAEREHQPVTAASLFGTDAGPGQGQELAFEEIIKPKKAYEVQPAVSVELAAEDDCWGTEEAMLEARHQQASEKDDYIRQLELEKERLQQETVELKVKSGKLLKKLKEYKVRCESLERRSASVETSELDLAIQEELNGQIRALEGRLSELQSEREKSVAEKESLLKRVDVLVAANERFTEMKERQDVQIEVQHGKIKELNAKLQQLEDWSESSEQKESKPAGEGCFGEDVSQLKSRIEELTREAQDLRVDNEELQALLEEEKANVGILEKRVQQKDGEIQLLMEQIDALSQDSQAIKSNLESLNQQKSQETTDLSQRLNDLMSKNTDLTHQIEKMRTESLFHSSEEEIKLQEQVHQLSAQLQYKQAEIVHLNEQIEQQAREDQTESLVQEIITKNKEISSLRSRIQQLEADRKEMEHNLTLQITQEMAATRSEDKAQPRVAELEQTNRELLDEKHQMEQELQVLNDQVLRSLELEDRMKGTVLELDAKNIEIEALKSSLEQLKQAQSQPSPTAAEDDLRQRIDALLKERTDQEANYRIALEQRDAHWAQVVEERGAQVAESWKQHVDMRETEFSLVERSLREEIDRLQATEAAEQRPVEGEQTIGDSPIVQQMKEALENQELEIVTLKEQLAIRSAEYARLAAQVDPFAVKHASNMVTSEPRSQPTDEDKVPRSELELALYVIYQRDMRCDELELELRNLLEERDALQLRLSNALRQQEEFKRKLTAPPEEASGDSSDVSKTTTPEKSLQQIVQESGISAAGSSSEASSVVLTNKLSELHSIGHAKDKRLQEEREQRNRQLTLIQRDVANMPLEAAAKIAGTKITQTESSTQQQQSASSVLINWILGKKSDT
ncbi:protein lava lamp [Sabethes cyaneus]|uniref:protein lava lamp n=1 Tax=Sabethes cyaneus TaxID=53552 RepID=UPI00221E2E11|nr:protein lava lamp [Sabethes cyaneus]